MDMKICRFLAYLSDGSTDAGIREQEIIYCHHVKGDPVTKFLGIQHLEHAHADGTLAAIEKVVCNHLDNTDTIYQKGGNCNFDGASVMSGCQGGLCTKMLQEKQPAMSFIHCIAHKLEIAVLDSVKSNTNLEKLQSTLAAMFRCYYYSPEKHRELQEMSSFLNEMFQQFGCLKNVCWLASRDRTLSIIKCNYSALVIHQENIAKYNDKNAATAKGHVKDLKSIWFVFSLHFIIDYVSKLLAASLVFQKMTC